MSPNQVKSEWDQDTDGSSINTAITPSESTLSDPADDNGAPLSRGASYSIPEPGSILIIRSVLSKSVVTLLAGQVVLVPPGSVGQFGSPYWRCVKRDGWLGFQNVASGKFLGRNSIWLLCCSTDWLREPEKFHIEGRPEGGYILLMQDWGKLRPVGITEDKGHKRLAMVEYENTNGIIWEFVEVCTFE